MKPYIFFREHQGKPMFYPVEYKTDDDAIAGAMHNAGTTKVETLDGLLVWPKPEHKQ